jgi:hypothetical protein
MRYVNRIVLCVLFCFSPMMALAGSLDDTGSPTTAGGGAMNTLEDIYNILDAGNTTEPRSGNFTEPTAGPAPTGHTLTEVYNRAKTSSRPAKTGQTTSYVTGDDGDLQKGVEWPSTRFTDNSDGTVTDELTGLIWLQDANCNGTKVAWDHAIDYCNALFDGCSDCFGTGGDCGLSDNSEAGDWRLPNVKELLSLIDFAYTTPSLSNATGDGKWSPGDAFTDVRTDSSYWASTSRTTVAWGWYVNMNYGHNYYNTKAGNIYYVWPVRGGQ